MIPALPAMPASLHCDPPHPAWQPRLRERRFVRPGVQAPGCTPQPCPLHHALVRFPLKARTTAPPTPPTCICNPPAAYGRARHEQARGGNAEEGEAPAAAAGGAPPRWWTGWEGVARQKANGGRPGILQPMRAPRCKRLRQRTGEPGNQAAGGTAVQEKPKAGRRSVWSGAASQRTGFVDVWARLLWR